MNILHICYSDRGGGAAIAAGKLHNTMLSQGLQSNFLVINKKSDGKNIIQAPASTRILIQILFKISNLIKLLQKPSDNSYRSLNIFPTGLHHVINSLSPDIVQFHWINKNTISISEIAKITAPVVWRLPDMWAFCGTEHYVSENRNRYSKGYHKYNKDSSHHGLDLDRYIWEHKQKHWKNLKLTIVCPSKWLSHCAQNSHLFKNYNIFNIPNPIDLDLYTPAANTAEIRRRFKLPRNKNLIMFVSVDVDADKRKGYSYLFDALDIFSAKVNCNDFELVILGSAKTTLTHISGFKINYLGYKESPQEIVSAYNAVDTVVLPTEADNLPNVIQEAMSCGTPCVSFDVGGLPDMITHQHDGYLARPCESADLAQGLFWMFEQDSKLLRQNARRSAEITHCPTTRTQEYVNIYKKLINT
ncbi:glycosyltransferase [Thermodesulfobacteriota bacterium]